MGKFRQCLTELSAHDTIMAGYYSLTFLFIYIFIFFFIFCLFVCFVLFLLHKFNSRQNDIFLFFPGNRL